MKFFTSALIKGAAFVAILFALVAANCGGGGDSMEVAAVLPLTGENAVYGQAIEKGIDLAVEEMAQDATLGTTIALNKVDTASDAAQAAELGKAALGSAMAAIGGVTSGEALALVPVARDRDMVLLSPTASSPKLTGVERGVFFRIFPTSTDEAAAMSNFMKETLKVEEIAVLAEDSDYGRDSAEAFKESFQGEVLGEATFTLATVADGAAAAVETGAKTVYLLATGDALAEAIKSLRGAGISGEGYRILTTSAIATPSVLEAAGSSAYGVYYTQAGIDIATDDKEHLAAFRDAYQAKYNAPPDLYAAYGYDAMKVIGQAIKEAGNIVLPSDISTGMRSIQGYQGVTGSIQFRENGDVQVFPRVFYIDQGKLVNFDTWYKARQEELQKKMKELRDQREKLLRNANN